MPITVNCESNPGVASSFRGGFVGHPGCDSEVRAERRFA
jgi:hypothetical protein